MKILVVEDDITQNQFIGHFIRVRFPNANVSQVHLGEEAIKEALKVNFDVIILDVNLPDISGFDICKTIKNFEEYGDPKIIILTSLDTQKDKVSGLRNGADYYIYKPFDKDELEIKLQHYINTEENEMIYGNIVISKDNIIYQGEIIKVTPKEHKCLSYFIKNAGMIIRKEVLYKEVWEKDYLDNNYKNQLQIVISRLKGKFPILKEKLNIEYGLGYRLREEE